MDIPDEQDAEALFERVKAALESLPADVVEEARVSIERKRVAERFERHVALINELVNAGPALLSTSSFEAAAADLDVLTKHVERIWRDSVLLFNSGSFARATFLSVVTMEETGKVGPSMFQLLVDDVHRRKNGEAAQRAPSPRRQNPAYSHRKKHLLVAFAGALVNSRVDRLFGLETIEAFIRRAEAGELEAWRQSCLYAERTTEQLHLPDVAISRETARLYVALSGELMAEALGWSPGEHERLLSSVKAFEVAAGLPSD